MNKLMSFFILIIFEGQKVDVANSSLQEESAKAFHNTNSIQPRIFNLK